MTPPALPRAVVIDPRHDAVVRALAGDARPLWRGGVVPVAHVAWTPSLAAALSAARRRGALALGLDGAASTLEAEDAGLAALVRRGEAQGARVSRLLLLADQGAERFQRQAERLLAAHARRLLGLRVAVAPRTLGAALVGREREVKAVLVSHRDAVAAVLFALA